MATNGQVLEGRGGRVVFETTAADSGGELLSTRSTLPPDFPIPPRHRHPGQAERFEVLAGRLLVEAGGVRHLLGPGEALTVAPGTPHRFAVPGPERADVRVTFRPAGDMEGFLERVADLEREGRLTPGGWPPLLRGARIALAHRADLRLAPPPGAIGGLLARLGRARVRARR